MVTLRRAWIAAAAALVLAGCISPVELNELEDYSMRADSLGTGFSTPSQAAMRRSSAVLGPEAVILRGGNP